MKVREYLEMEAPSQRFDDLVFLTHRWDEYSYRGLAEDSASFDRLMATGTAACLHAAPSPGRHPLVLYSAGWFNRAPDNTVLAEYLASHGFVVAAVPQVNPGLWTYNFASDPPSVENQIRDLEMAIGVLADESMVDRRRVAAMGYSTGGDVALLLQGRNPLVDAVVGLDASWTLGPGNDVEGADLLVLSQHDVPILAARRPVGDTAADRLLDTLTAAPRIILEIPTADHGTFSDDPTQRLLLGTDTQAHAATHATMAQAVLTFLTHTLRETQGEIDGDNLVERYVREGLNARFIPAKPVSDGPTENPGAG